MKDLLYELGIFRKNPGFTAIALLTLTLEAPRVLSRSAPFVSASQGWSKLEQTHWSNGRRITVVMFEPGNSERQAVLAQIYKMGERDFNNYFLHGMFTGEIHAAPKALPSSAEVLKFILNVPGAIGYVKNPDVNESVKVVRVESRLPSEKEYLLRLHGKLPK